MFARLALQPFKSLRCSSKMWGIQRLRFLHPVTGCSLHCLICELSFATQPSLNQEHRSRHKCWKHGFTSKVTQQILVDSWDRAFMQILVMSCQDPAIKQGRENTMNILKINEKIMTKQICTATPLNLSLTNDSRFGCTMLR